MGNALARRWPTLTAMVEESLSSPRNGSCMSFLPDEEGGTPDCWAGPALDVRVRAYAQALVDRTEPGDRVLLVSSAGPEEVSALLACFYAGRVAVPLPPPEAGRAHRALSRIQSVVADARPALVVLGPSAEAHRDLFGPLPALTAADLQGPLARPLTPRPDDLAILQYTSGSTSAPKGVMLGHRQLLANLEMMALRFGLGPTTPIVSWLPLFHDMGADRTSAARALCAGALRLLESAGLPAVAALLAAGPLHPWRRLLGQPQLRLRALLSATPPRRSTWDRSLRLALRGEWRRGGLGEHPAPL